jgi:AcrR family transcriptional regulator
MAHKNKTDWLNAGLDILVKNGASQLTIERLCLGLCVTKGSFYHHFRGQQDYIDKLLVYWQNIDTLNILEGIKSQAKNAHPVDGLLTVLGNRPAETAQSEIAFRAWGLQDAGVRSEVEKIDRHRLNLLKEMFISLGKDEPHSELLAQMLYTMLVGCYSIIPPLETEKLLSMYAEFKRTFSF